MPPGLDSLFDRFKGGDIPPSATPPPTAPLAQLSAMTSRLGLHSVQPYLDRLQTALNQNPHYTRLSKTFANSRLGKTIAANRLTSGIAAFASILVILLIRDYRLFLSLGPGGLPYNFRGWFVSTFLLRPLSRNTTSTKLYDRASLPLADEPAWLPESFPPPRKGGRPKLGSHPVPQRQVGDLPSKELRERLGEQFLELSKGLKESGLVEVKKSVHENHCDAMFVRTKIEKRHAVALETRGEIAHCHTGDGSLHVVLSPADCKKVITAKWGQRHPLDGVSAMKRFAGFSMPVNYLFLYAPRNGEEIEIVLDIVCASVGFMTQNPDMMPLSDSSSKRGKNRRHKTKAPSSSSKPSSKEISKSPSRESGKFSIMDALSGGSRDPAAKSAKEAAKAKEKEKERERELEKQAAKEAKRKEKEAAREAEEREKEAARQAKEREKETAREAKEAAREAKEMAARAASSISTNSSPSKEKEEVKVSQRGFVRKKSASIDKAEKEHQEEKRKRKSSSSDIGTPRSEKPEKRKSSSSEVGGEKRDKHDRHKSNSSELGSSSKSEKRDKDKDKDRHKSGESEKKSGKRKASSVI